MTCPECNQETIIKHVLASIEMDGQYFSITYRYCLDCDRTDKPIIDSLIKEYRKIQQEINDIDINTPWGFKDLKERTEKQKEILFLLKGEVGKIS